jgi:uncharacterized protein (TIGR02001 family)
MNKIKLLAIALGAVLALPVMAEEVPAAGSPVTYNFGFVSDYVVRGLTQTVHNPALQGGADYVHTSGVYVGAWASNVRWIKESGALTTGDASVELDTYLGYRDFIVNDWSYDLGYIRYNYLGNYEPTIGFNRADTAEVYAATAYKWVSLKYSYSLLDGFLTTPGTKGTNYLDMTVTYPLGKSGATAILHYGKQSFVGTTSMAGKALGYEDYKVALTQDFSSYVLGLSYTATNATSAWTFGGQEWGKETVLVSLVHTF